MIESGIFTLKTPQQLFGKMLEDHKRVQCAPRDSSAWFNFFVTADHLPEWLTNGDEDVARKLREQNALLRVCHYLAINAKHFKARELKPKAGQIRVSPIARTHEAHTAQLNKSELRREPISTDPEFYLELSKQEAAELHVADLSALELANRLVEFWKERLSQTT
jgi:hypothetical protein